MAQTPEGARKSAAAKIGMTYEAYTAKVAAGEKRCFRCKTWKPIGLFCGDVTRHDGLNAACGECRRVKVRVVTKGRPSAFKGKSHTAESRAKMSADRKGRPGTHVTPHSSETRAKMSVIARERTPRGEKHYAYSHGKHQRDKCDRRSVEYQQWRTAVYSRDGYTCRHCGDDKGGNLQAHHVKPFAGNPGLRFDVDNGVTLCRDCHEKVHMKPIPTRADLRRRRRHLA